MSEKKRFETIGKGMGILTLIATVLILLSSVAGAAKLVAKYDFNEGSGDILTDSSGNGNHGKIYGATWIDNGIHGKALLFDGIDDRVVIPDSPGLSGGTGKNLTVLYSFNASLGETGGTVIAKVKDTAYKEWYTGMGSFFGGTPAIFFYYEKNNANNDMRFYGGVPKNEIWNRGGFSFQAANPAGTNTAKLKMYLNGEKLGLSFWNDHSPYSVSPDRLYDMPDTNTPVTIGYSGSYYNSNHFRGPIDAIYIYEGVLSDEEIKADNEEWTGSAIVKTGLNFPLEGYTPYSASVSSIMDHSMPSIYEKDGIVRAFNGEEGNVSYGCCSYSKKTICTEKNYSKKEHVVVGYKNSKGTVFLSQLNYKDTYLYYDGHPGYDYPATSGTDIFAPANGTLCLVLDDKKKDGVLWRNSTNCTNLSVAKQTTTNWVNYHTFYIIHEGLVINGTSSDYITTFLHSDNLSKTIYEEVKTNGYARVNKSQHIAETGGYGKKGADSYGSHIHLEVFKRNGTEWNRVDPYGDGVNDILWKTQ